MGWNSWNKFAQQVDDVTVRGMADAMVASGMRDAGYTYINIDDTWEGPRDAQGNITGNLKFPNMKGLADYVHSKGLKIGIYSSPGPKTCGGYGGSYGHEEQDAKTYAAWGFDYLKYDWCSAGRIYKDSDMRRGLPEDGRCPAGHRPPHRFQPLPVRRATTFGSGAPRWAAISGAPPAISTISGRGMDEIGFSQFDIASYCASPATGTIPTCWKSATAA